MSTIAAVPGSFDPLTLGHLYVIEQALKVAEQVRIYVSVNASKKGLFTFQQRSEIIFAALHAKLEPKDVQRVTVTTLPGNQFIAREAVRCGAQFIIRGLRNTVDFEYEKDQAMFNAEIEPAVTTLFVVPPADLTRVSSSALKGMVGIEGWLDEAYKYLPPASVDALKATEGKTRLV